MVALNTKAVRRRRGLNRAALLECLSVLRERAVQDGRAADVGLVDAALAGDARAALRARVGPVSPSLRQREVLELIDRSAREVGCPPTLDEIGLALGINKVSVFEVVGALERKGVVRRATPRQARGLLIVDRRAVPADDAGPAAAVSSN